MNKTADTLTSIVASTASLWRGTKASPAPIQPLQLLELYDMENCPYCRVVRELLTVLDIDAMIYPCPKGGKRYRAVVMEMGGKAQFPFLVDKNTGAQMYESADIVAYLGKTYGKQGAMSSFRAFKLAGSMMSSLSRPGRGNRVRASREPEQPLVLYSFESSPFSRPVRELLCELELPYELRSTGKAMMKDMGPPALRAALFPDEPVRGRNRVALLERADKVQVPYLIDPNTRVDLFESADIVKYLTSTYAYP
ncbi:MAG: glutathione S-transferase [Halieaceae bacterium]|jgi:glutathione S-transferase